MASALAQHQAETTQQEDDNGEELSETSSECSCCSPVHCCGAKYGKQLQKPRLHRNVIASRVAVATCCLQKSS